MRPFSPDTLPVLLQPTNYNTKVEHKGDSFSLFSTVSSSHCMAPSLPVYNHSIPFSFFTLPSLHKDIPPPYTHYTDHSLPSTIPFHVSKGRMDHPLPYRMLSTPQIDHPESVCFHHYHKEPRGYCMGLYGRVGWVSDGRLFLSHSLLSLCYRWASKHIWERDVEGMKKKRGRRVGKARYE